MSQLPPPPGQTPPEYTPPPENTPPEYIPPPGHTPPEHSTTPPGHTPAEYTTTPPGNTPPGHTPAEYTSTPPGHTPAEYTSTPPGHTPPEYTSTPPTIIGGPPPGYQAWAPDSPRPGQERTDGKLIAAGVLCLISGGVTGLLGLWLFALTADSDTAWIDDLSGGALTFFALIMLGIAAVYITAGVGSVRGRNWGRITAIVINAIFVGLTIIGFVSEPNGGSIVPLAWCGTIIGLAWTGSPKQTV